MIDFEFNAAALLSLNRGTEAKSRGPDIVTPHNGRVTRAYLTPRQIERAPAARHRRRRRPGGAAARRAVLNARCYFISCTASRRSRATFFLGWLQLRRRSERSEEL
jgi:hypothetical protein